MRSRKRGPGRLFEQRVAMARIVRDEAARPCIPRGITRMCIHLAALYLHDLMNFVHN